MSSHCIVISLIFNIVHTPIEKKKISLIFNTGRNSVWQRKQILRSSDATQKKPTSEVIQRSPCQNSSPLPHLLIPVDRDKRQVLQHMQRTKRSN